MNPKNTSNKINYTLNCNGKLVLVQKPLVMGIVNITPDSFYANSRATSLEDIVEKATKMVQDGAEIIDLGAQSTRPNSSLLNWEEEWSRLEIPLKELRKSLPNTIISVDTFYSKVAQRAVALGADIINDISGGEMDAQMIATIATLPVTYICMHMQGTPQTMQNNPTYNNVTLDVLNYFEQKKAELETAGVTNFIFDVGFGFGKTIAQNFELLNNLDSFSVLQNPLLVGLSRKSMLYKTLHITAEESLNATTIANTIAIQKGAAILRVHDVKEAVEVINLSNSIYS